MTQLTENFTLEELIVTSTRYYNVPDPTCVSHLQRLATTLLQPLRDHLQRPLFITSGYRSKWVNGAVGGAKNSFHLTGDAADISFGKDCATCIKAAIYAAAHLPYSELIISKRGMHWWLHVAYAPESTKHLFTFEEYEPKRR